MTQSEQAMQSATTVSRIAPIAFAMMTSMTSGGVIFGFGLFTNDIRLLHHLTQDQINTISSAIFCAGLLTWMPGLVVDHLGIRFAFLFGTSLCLVASWRFWLMARAPYDADDSKSDLVIELSILGMLVYLGAMTTVGSSFKIVAVLSKPSQEGTLIGIAKGYTGIGAGVYTAIFEAVRRQRNSHARAGALTALDQSNIGFIVVASTLSFLTTVPALWIIPSRQVLEGPMQIVGTFTAARVNVMYAGLVVLAVSVLVTSSLITQDDSRKADVDEAGITILSNTSDGVLDNYGFSVAVAIFFLWVGPAFVVSTCMAGSKPKAEAASHEYDDCASGMDDIEDSTESNIKQQQLLSEHTALLKHTSTEITDLQTTVHDGDNNDDNSIISSDKKVNLNLLQALQTPELWLMFHCTVIVVGSGTLLTSNVSAIVESRRLPDDLTPIATSVFSVAQSASRVIAGLLTEMASVDNNNSSSDGDLDWFGWHSRPSFLSLAAFLAAVAHGILAIPGLGPIGFIFGVALAGIAFGTVWPLMVLVVGDVFGKANLGTIYLWFDGCTIGFGTLMFTKFLSEYIYERHRVHSNAMESSSCIGDGCFQLTHIIVALLCLTAIVSPFELSRRTHKRFIR